MTRPLATTAFAMLLSAAAAIHGAFAQTHEAEMTADEIAAQTVALSKSIGIHMEMRIEEVGMPFETRLAALDNAQAGRPRDAKAGETREAPVLVVALAQ